MGGINYQLHQQIGGLLNLLYYYNVNPPKLPWKSAGRWFQPLWKILVSWDYYSQYMEK